MFLHLIGIVLLIKLLSLPKLKQTILYLAKIRNKGISPIDVKQIERWGAIFPSLFSCLPQAIAVKLLDASAEVHFGVQNKVNFEAHAWAEKEGKILIGERPMDNFKSMWVW